MNKPGRPYNVFDQEFVEHFVPQFFAELPPENCKKVTKRFMAIRQRKLSAPALELLLAKAWVNFQNALELICQLHKSDNPIDSTSEAYNLEDDVTDQVLEQLLQQVNLLLQKPKEIARKGGLGRAAKYDRLREQTIRLYERQTWKNAATAALAITPQIVEMSRNGNGDLAPTTSKPLAWIREYIRMKKTSS